MFEKLRQSKLMFWSLEILIIVVLIIGLTDVSFLFSPIATFFSTLLIPMIVAGFLFYLFNPLINLLGRMHIKRGWGILLVFVVFFGLIIFLVATIIPNLINQVTQLVTALPSFYRDLTKEIAKLSSYEWYKRLGVAKLLSSISIKPSKILSSILGSFSTGLPSIVGSVASFFINLITIPVMLFYMLKDGNKFVPSIQKFFPDRYHDEIKTVFTRMSGTLSHYIAGQAIECLFVGTFTFIGYLIIGMPYAFLLGFVAGVTTLIPYLGPYIGIAPALLVALPSGWGKIIMVIIVVLIVQQVDGNLIYPNVIGRSLDIHPLTIIILLLVAGNIFGLLGTILAVPVYAVVKTIVTYAVELYRFHRDQAKKAELTLPTPKEKK